MHFLFDPDSKIMQFFGRFTDIVVLNAVFLLTCIPLFTIGAANAALYDTVFRMDTEREGTLLATYFRAFRANFKQSTAIWLLLVLFMGASYLNMVNFSNLGGTGGYVLFLFAMIIFVMLWMVFSYAFPLLSQFSNSTKETLKNALILALAHLPRSLILLITNCFPWVLMILNLYSFMQLSFLWTFLYFAAAAYFNSRVLNKVFKPYWEQSQSAPDRS